MGMEQFDFYCQICKKDISNAFFNSPHWYVCSQDKNKYASLRKVYPLANFKIVDGKIVFDDLQDNPIPDELSVFIDKRLKLQFPFGDVFESSGPEYVTNNIKVYTLKFDVKRTTDHSERRLTIPKTTFLGGEINWSDNRQESEYYEKAGIKHHELVSQGAGGITRAQFYTGYTIDIECAKKLDYKCNVCGSPLEKILRY